jgi:hypothetical protein
VADEPESKPVDPRYAQRNFAERLFPGPSKQMSEQVAQRIEGLLKERGNDKALQAWRERQGRVTSQPPAVDAPAPTATVDEFAEVGEKLEQQNELLRAILASTVDTQADARATAQNSRTFAWAGTAIALLTLIATVISVVAAVQGH